MQKLIFFFLLILLTPVAQAEHLRVVSWNMDWFPGGSPTSSLPQRTLQMSAAKEVLLQLKPDIFAAQEVRDWKSFEEVTSILPHLTPLVVSRYRNSPTGGGLSVQQVGIASVFSASSGWTEFFRVAKNSPPRGFSFAAIPIAGKNVLVYAVHFKANNRKGGAANMAKREEAARQLLQHLHEMEKIYGKDAIVLICGDLNTDPSDPRFADENTLSILEEAGFVWGWEGVPLEKRVTVPTKGSYPDACFDGFLIRGNVEVLSCYPEKVVSGSDHYPVVLELALK